MPATAPARAHESSLAIRQAARSCASRSTSTGASRRLFAQADKLAARAWAAATRRRPDALLELLEEVIFDDQDGRSLRALLAVAEREHQGVLWRAAAYIHDGRLSEPCVRAVIDFLVLDGSQDAALAIERFIQTASVGVQTGARLETLARTLCSYAAVAGRPVGLLLGIARDEERSHRLRFAALETLGLLRSAAAVDGLIEMASTTRSPSLRRQATLALGVIGNPSCIEFLGNQLQNGAPESRVDAARALARIDSAAARAALAAARLSPFAAVRREVDHLFDRQTRRLAQRRELNRCAASA